VPSRTRQHFSSCSNPSHLTWAAKELLTATKLFDFSEQKGHILYVWGAVVQANPKFEIPVGHPGNCSIWWDQIKRGQLLKLAWLFKKICPSEECRSHIRRQPHSRACFEIQTNQLMQTLARSGDASVIGTYVHANVHLADVTP